MAPKKDDRKGSEEVLTRIAIVSEDRCVFAPQTFLRWFRAEAAFRGLRHLGVLCTCRCKPKKCRQECKKMCPVVKVGEQDGGVAGLRSSLLHQIYS